MNRSVKSTTAPCQAVRAVCGPKPIACRLRTSVRPPLCFDLKRDATWRLCSTLEEDFLFGREESAEDRRSTGRRQDGLEERVIDLSRVATTVKGGRHVSFRAVMVVGDGKGNVGIGNASAKEIPLACQRATEKAKQNMIHVELNENFTFPHIQEAKFCGARVILRPAGGGTGVIAGGAVRSVLEVAGVRNGFGKILNGPNHMNNAKAAVKALSMMRTVKEVAQQRGVSLDYLFGKTVDPKDSAYPPQE